MSWTALVALKTPHVGKSRLAAILDPATRAKLSLAMLDRLRRALEDTAAINRIVLITRVAPDGWPHDWLLDEGRGLNGELEAALAACDRPALAIHADLPLVSAQDITHLLDEAARHGLALAPDRHGAGTNAVALGDARPFSFQFGEGSLARHRATAGDPCALVRCEGLSLDLDTPGDLALARRGGFCF